jgi:hypothetical protein
MTAVLRFGRIAVNSVRVCDEPRLSAASVSVFGSMALSLASRDWYSKGRANTT